MLRGVGVVGGCMTLVQTATVGGRERTRINGKGCAAIDRIKEKKGAVLPPRVYTTDKRSNTGHVGRVHLLFVLLGSS